MQEGFPEFRLGRVLATCFTGTISERYGDTVERIPTPDRFRDWLAVNELAVGRCTIAELALARALRESIHAAASAKAQGKPLPTADVAMINECSGHGRAAAVLVPEGNRQWDLGATPRVRDALTVIAADAISMIAGERDGRLALCASTSCQAVFLDSSQSRTRRWCDMNTCGNREKKARFLENQRAKAAKK